MSGYTPPRCSKPRCRERAVARRLCRKHYQAAWKAGAFKNAPIRRTSAPQVCPPDHKHGTNRVCYVQHQCRCSPCRDTNRAHGSARNKAIAYGRYDNGLVDVTPVRDHLTALVEFGLGYKRIGDLAGLPTHVPRNVLWGRQTPGPRYGELPKRIKRENAEKLLAVQPLIEHLSGGAPVPARASMHRLNTLIAFGYSQNRLATMIGWHSSNLAALRLRYETAAAAGNDLTAKVNASTHRAIADLYERLALTPPTPTEHRDRISVARARRMGAERGWPLPMDWASVDDDFDRRTPPLRSDRDPNLVAGGLDDGAVQQALHGDPSRLGPAERREVIRRLHARRLTDPEIATMLRMPTRSVFRIRHEELRLPANVNAARQLVEHAS